MIKILFVGNRWAELSADIHDNIKNKIADKIRELQKTDEVVVLTGLNIGIEMWAAEVAREVKVPYWYYHPFDNPHSKWPFVVRKQYSELVKHTNKKVTIGEGEFDVKKLAAKEIAMIDCADQVYGFFISNNHPTMRLINKFKKTYTNLLATEEEPIAEGDYIPF